MCLGAVLLLCDQAGMALGAVTKRVCGQQCSILYCTVRTVQYSTGTWGSHPRHSAQDGPVLLQPKMLGQKEIGMNCGSPA